MSAIDVDSLMTAYGIGTTADSVDVCETWTGSDYKYSAIALGSSDNIPGLTDTVQSVGYDAGGVAGYTTSGAPATNASEVGPSAFEFMNADDPTRQASYDYPYYGVSSPDPVACTRPPCPAMSVGTPNDRNGSTILKSDILSGDSTKRFARHGITRLGVRALVENATEILPSAEGYRRFRFRRGSVTSTLSLDPRTQLLMREELGASGDTTITNHTWKRIRGGYVRSRSDIEVVEIINGKKFHSRSTLVFTRVRVTDPAFPSLVDSAGKL